MRRHPQRLGLLDFWLEKTGRILGFERSHREQCHALRYEDLVMDPATNAKALFDFLKLPCPANLAEQVFELPHDL